MANLFSKWWSRSYEITPDRDEWVTPEETLIDSGSRFADLEQPITPAVFRVIAVLAAAGMFVIAGFLVKMTVFEHAAYADMSFKNKTVNFAIVPPRGLILDRTGKLLVQNVPSFDVLAVSREAKRELQANPSLSGELAAILEVQPEVMSALLEENFKESGVFFVASDITKDQVLALKRLNPKGFYVITSTKRSYVNGPQFSSVIGYTGKVSGDDLAEDGYYLSSDVIGRLGVEAFYEKELRGTHGRIYFTKDRGTTSNEEPVPGSNVVLNIDFDMQRKLYSQVSQKLAEAGLKSGAAIVQNPQNGAILALVSFPSYDNNIFTSRVSPEEYANLFENKYHPLFNRAISGLYSPGSTIKPFIGMAALQERVVTPSDTINDCVDITVPNPFDSENPYIFKNWRVERGLFNMRRAIANSCNVYFFTVGGGFGRFLGLGVDRIVHYLTSALADVTLGIDLPGEEHGFIPTPDWKLKTKRENWYQGDTYNISIGQGDLLVSPLWLTSYVSAIANGGTIFKPMVANRILDEQDVPVTTFQSQVLGQLPFSQEVIREMRSDMRETVLSGTAKKLKDLPVPAAAKTGTAEVVAGHSINSLFTAFAPVDVPQVSISVLIEGSESNQGYAIDIAHEFLQWYFQQTR